MSRENPDLHFLPRVFGKEEPAGGKKGSCFLFVVIQSRPATGLAVPVDNEQEDIHHAAVTLQYLLKPFPIAGLVNAS